MLHLNARVLSRSVRATVIGVALAACSGDNTAPSGPTVAVAIADTTFAPAEVTVPAGGAVQWTNTSQTERHNLIPVTAGAFKQHDALIKKAETVTIRFSKVGDYAYYCALHGSPTGGQRGVIHVTA